MDSGGTPSASLMARMTLNVVRSVLPDSSRWTVLSARPAWLASARWLRSLRLRMVARGSGAASCILGVSVLASGFSPVYVFVLSGLTRYTERVRVTVTISADDPRTIRAIELAAEADYWLKGRNPDGVDVYGVPSQSDSGRYYIVTASSCDCPDFARGGGENPACKHMLAVRLYRELVKAQHQPRHAQPRRQRAHLTLLGESP
jgi:SWIM zinc finger